VRWQNSNIGQRRQKWSGELTGDGTARYRKAHFTAVRKIEDALSSYRRSRSYRWRGSSCTNWAGRASHRNGPKTFGLPVNNAVLAEELISSPRGGTADASDLKSDDPKWSCGFDSHRGH
jgi:hypothetical protein